MHPLLQTVLQTVRNHALLEAGDTVFVGLSGGADSVTLLHSLLSLRETLGLADIRAIHVHHGLRGESADRDEAFVRTLCEHEGVPLSVYHIDTKAEATEHHESLEEAGRRCRYALFEKEASSVAQAKIATAHSQSDHAETVLLNMARGCGTAGLCGIPVRRGNIVRPLLRCTAEEIRAFCHDNGYAYMVDETNADPSFARNRVRNELIPVLRTLNTKAVEHIAALADKTKEEHAFITRCAKAAWDAARVQSHRYNVECLLRMEPVLFTTGLKDLICDMGGRAERVHLDTLAATFRTGGAVTVPGDVLIRSDGQILELAHATRHQEPPPKEQTIAPPCEVWFAGTHYRVRCLSRRDYNDLLKVHKKLFYFCISYDMINHGAYLRTRRDGDQFRPFPRGCTKSLKKWCNEEQLPLDKRATLPVLCDEHGVLAILGYAVDERAAVTNTTEQIGWFEVLSD